MTRTNHFFIFLYTFFTTITTIVGVATLDFSRTNVSTILFFGDSTLDTGNNNHLKHTFMHANHPPYGVNFPKHVATGRFCDGRLFSDFMASMFGIKETVPAYKSVVGENHELLTGVVFASAGSGLDYTTSLINNVYSMEDELRDFEDYVGRVERMVGVEKGKEIVRKALVVICSGSNDMMINYYGIPYRRLEYGLDGYHSFMLKNLRTFVEKIYKLGVRRMIVAGLPPIGCVPLIITRAEVIPGSNFFTRSCVDDINHDSMTYNSKLKTLLKSMQTSLHGSKIVYADIYSPLMDIVKNPAKYGFEVTDRGCCGSGLVEAGIICEEFSPLCSDPSKYVFFDSAHPTQEAYKHLSAGILEFVAPNLW